MHGNSSDGSRWNAVDVDLFVDVGTAVLARTWVQWSRSESCEFCDRSRLSTESPSSRFVYSQGDHLSGKPGNVREFDSCQGNVRDFSISQGNVREKILSGKSCLKLFTVSCIFASIRVFSTSTDILWVTLNMPWGNWEGIVREFHIVWRAVTLLSDWTVNAWSCSVIFAYALAVWLSGNALASINVVALRHTRLVAGWVTVCGRINYLDRSTQPSTLRGTVKWVSAFGLSNNNKWRWWV